MGKLYLGSTEVVLPGGGGSPVATLPTFRPGEITSVTAVTAGSTAHVKGAWVEMIASTAATTHMLIIYPTLGTNGAATDALLDIGIGASGSETVLVGNIAVGGLQSPWPVIVPVTVSSGVRVSFRAQCVTASRALNFTLHTVADVPSSLAATSIDVLGINTGTSRGTTVNAASGWVEVIASTTKAYKSLVLVPSVQGLTNPNNGSFIRVATGAAGAEQMIIESQIMASNTESIWTSPAYANPSLTTISGPVASGTRLSVATSSTLSVGLCLIGVPA